jgi:hypothetical protein
VGRPVIEVVFHRSTEIAAHGLAEHRAADHSLPGSLGDGRQRRSENDAGQRGQQREYDHTTVLHPASFPV